MTGPKHSGKSSTAMALGKITGLEISDLDVAVERQTGKTPRQLYLEGPEIFREAEAQALESLIGHSGGDAVGGIVTTGGIIAAGGGLIDNTEALSLLAERGNVIVVFLKISPETAWQRILQTAAGGELPPFLNTANPKETHRALHERRALAYEALADLTVNGEKMSPEEIADYIAKKLCL